MRLNCDANFSDVIKELGISAKDAVNASNNEIKVTALAIERNAKQKAPLDTGRLRGSITHNFSESMGGVEADIGTNVEYANYIEYGTRKRAAKPFLNPAFNEETQDLERRIEAAIRAAFAQGGR